MYICNLTPHGVVVRPDGGQEITIPPSGMVARVSTVATPTVPLDGLPVVCHVYGDIAGLPAPAEHTAYLVSAIVMSALRDAGAARTDIYAPDTSPDSVVRDEAGKIVAVRRLVAM